jgi:integrase
VIVLFAMNPIAKENDNVLSGESWEYFQSKLKNRNPETAKVYDRYMRRYLTDTNTSPDEFYNYVKSHLESEDRRKIGKLENEFIDYYTSLITEQGFHIQTVLNYENSILAFLEANYLKDRIQFRIKFNGKMKQNYPRSFTNNGKDKAEIDEIKRLVTYMSNPRNISAVLTMRDTGLRVSDIANLQIKHIQPIIDDLSLRWYTFEITPIKNLKQDTPLPANPVMGYESIEALRIWLNYRVNKYGLSNSDPDSYVYCAIYNYPATEKRSETKIGNKIIASAFSRMMRHERTKAGIENEISPHSLRKTHSTNLIGGGVPERWVNVMIGKKGQGSQGFYQKPNRTELIEVYEKAYPQLSLDSTSIKQVSAMQQQIQDLENQAQMYETRFNNLDSFIKKFIKPSMEDLELAEMNDVLHNDPIQTQKLIHRDDLERYTSEGWELTGEIKDDPHRIIISKKS